MVIRPLLLAFRSIVLLGGVWERILVLLHSKHLLICIFLVYLLLLSDLFDKILKQLLHITVDLVLVGESITGLVLGCCGSVLIIMA